MTASIVINTYNRARSLERLLPSLAHLADAVFEVIVVNGPSTDDTEAVLARYGDHLKIAHCPGANLSQSRNIGIAHAAGDVVVFIDDDALPGDSQWLQHVLERFAEDESGHLGAVGGPAWHGDTEWKEFSGGWTSDYAEQLFTDQPLPPGADPARWYRRTVGNNSAFRRAALLAIGGFDERFAYYLDEADVCLRLVRAGYVVAHDERCAVRHYPAQSPLGPPFIRSRRLIARSDTYYCLKNGSDPLPRRLVETLWRAPRKHFVRELRGLVDDGRVTRADAWRLRWQWLRGVVEGLALGLCAARAHAVSQAPPPAFLPFGLHDRARQLSICLLSRNIPPEPHGGGVGRYTYDLARGLHELGHRVTLLTESDVPCRHVALGLEIRGVTATRPPNGLRQTPLLEQNLTYADAVLARIEQCGRDGAPFDVVHASNWGNEALGIAQRDAVPLVLMLVTPLERVIAAEGWSLTQDLSANIELDQWIIEHATRVCGPSAGVLGSYEDRAHWTGRPVHPVPLGIYPGEQLPRQAHARRRLLFVGRLERRKGIHILLDVLPDLLATHPDWQCDIVGNASVPSAPGDTFASAFRARHAAAGWMGRVTFHGTVTDAALQAFYRDADLFVAPSLYESFGLIYLEAMQYGVPVVGCRVGGVPEVVTHDEDGFLVPPGDAAALSTALDRLMRDDALRRRLAEQAARSVRTTHSHVAMAARMLEHYRAAITAQVDRAQEAASTHAPSSLIEAALAVLDECPATTGLSVAYHASAAFERGERARAADLIVQALGVAAHPDYFTMAIELALSDGDSARAEEFAWRGFETTHDDSDAALVFAATIMDGDTDRQASSTVWAGWQRRHAQGMAARLLGVAVTTIRSGRDSTAILLLERCRPAAPRDRRLQAQVDYHLGSALKRQGRRADARVCFERVASGDSLALLPEPLQAALHFHLGELDLRDGHAAAAVKRFEACVALNPSHGRARASLAEATAAADAA
jgi:glycosyltransferase involved in cell wall biosynthesis